MALDEPKRTRPMDWAPTIAVLAPAQLVKFAHRHAEDPRHHWNDPAWCYGVSLESRVEPDLLQLRARYATVPGVEIH
jgi:hypothetical protein